MYEPRSVAFVRAKRRKMDTDLSRCADDENNCISAKRRKTSMDKSPGTTDDSGWNVGSHLTTTTPKSNSILTTTNTSSPYCDVDADDRHFQNENTEKTLCDLYLRTNADYGKIQRATKKTFFLTRRTTCCAIVVECPTRCYTHPASPLDVIGAGNEGN